MAFNIFDAVEESPLVAENNNESVFCVTRRFFENTKTSDLKHMKFCLGDTINVYISGMDVPFSVKHITDDGKVYFVATKIVCRSTYEDIERILENMFDYLPEDFMAIMERIKHVSVIDGTEVRVETDRKLTLPSYNNVAGTFGQTTEDDIFFDGFKSSKDRIMDDKDGIKIAWWTDTRSKRTPRRCMYIEDIGNLGCYTYLDSTLGVVPMFCIKTDAS